MVALATSTRWAIGLLTQKPRKGSSYALTMAFWWSKQANQLRTDLAELCQYFAYLNERLQRDALSDHL